jgi:hypothetical protein
VTSGELTAVVIVGIVCATLLLLVLIERKKDRRAP